MKKLLCIVALLVIAGCQQKNLTWTPTPQEWQLMAPTERNEWYRAENEARYRRARALQNWSNNLPMGSAELYQSWERRGDQRRRDRNLDGIDQSLQGIDSSLKARRYGY